MSNQAAWLEEQGKELRIAPNEVSSPGPDEIVVRNRAVAINPVDWKMQDHGYFIAKYPVVLGCDISGEVVETGQHITRFRKGDRVVAHCVGLTYGQPKYGGFQQLTVVPGNRVALLPDVVSFEDASVLPLALSTAAAGLYESHEYGFMGLEYPSLEPKPSGKTIVVYGGSSSVGALTTQLAAASGAHVIAIASERNFDLCRNAGARDVLDYRSSDVVEQTVRAIERTGGDFVGVYDAISLEDQSFNITLPILEKAGGGNLAVVLSSPQRIPAGVKVGEVFALHDSVEPVWREYVSPALAQGKLKCIPPPSSVGKGLEHLQKAMEANKKGVSAQKIIVQL